MIAFPISPCIFICYAHADNNDPAPSRRWLDRLLEQLEPLNLKDQAIIWSDHRLEMGDTWHEEIQTTLQQVHAAVLLVSPAFLKSKYIRNSEVPVLLHRAKEQGVLILPIILRPCLFNETTFKYPDPQQGPDELSLNVFQAANSVSKPLNSLKEHEQDQVLLAVAQRLIKVIKTPQPLMSQQPAATVDLSSSSPEGKTSRNTSLSTTTVTEGTANIGKDVSIIHSPFYQPNWKVENVYQAQGDVKINNANKHQEIPEEEAE